jgi:hypothetical protein
LKLLFFFKVNAKEMEVKQYLLRVDYESRNNQSRTDWLRNLGRWAVLQFEGGRKIASWEFTVAAAKIVQSFELGASLDSEEAQNDGDIQGKR